jgi:hypothetical protein
MPPVVAVRWMNDVAVSRSPSGPALVASASMSNHGMAVASIVTPSTLRPRTELPSFACHVGPPEWEPRDRPLSSVSTARGATSAHAYSAPSQR